ncbi:Smr/MutS family protein, partial [bacterium]|nr:Smr/MutS family protein [bacterium]
MKKRNKNKLPVLDSDQDFLTAFEKQSNSQANDFKQDSIKNSVEKQKSTEDDCFSNDEDFATILEESFKTKRIKTIKKPESMPLKKRLKRYPGVELELDLHGYNAIGAQLKLRSFIQSCKHQGYFTLRIIVGKGLHSENGAVLPDVVEDELKNMKKENFVISYEWEKKHKVQSGAIVVYLKQFE